MKEFRVLFNCPLTRSADRRTTLSPDGGEGVKPSEQTSRGAGKDEAKHWDQPTPGSNRLGSVFGEGRAHSFILINHVPCGRTACSGLAVMDPQNPHLHQDLRNDAGRELVGEALVQPVALVNQVSVIHSQQMKHGGVEVMDAHPILHSLMA